MAETINLPKQVVDSDWKDDVDVDYAIYGGNEKEEKSYISPNTISEDAKNKIATIKKRNIKIGRAAMLFSSKI